MINAKEIRNKEIGIRIIVESGKEPLAVRFELLTTDH